MGFGDQIKQFSNNAQKVMEQGKKQVEENAHKRLREILGADYSLIKSIRLDAEIGKFYASMRRKRWLRRFGQPACSNHKTGG